MKPWQLWVLAELIKHPDRKVIVSMPPQHPQRRPR
ncbi:hypothetical protein SEA_DONNY_43 [Mycobacterium phage Donny]|uniref:Uncharacterized protein n=2 Tax=Acadianvirus acadian TaxID=1982901 RepID=A0A7M1CMB9_9CAUD|nr:hypothetical protein SEA_DONNY_43 [Mycobacterium phage Donny]QOP65585.1 hypothetical protein SEA_SUIGENERIS_43 [Mycobacterium phage Suigeneris]WUT94813.1 hypothetical protein PRODRIGUEZ_43 [Mycobacterium phage PRodriguez]